MKAQIEEILKENLSITQCGYMNSQADLDGLKDASEILEHLMCYREVKAIMDWIRYEYFVPDYERPLIEQLEKSYDSDLIHDVIEQYKTEQK